MVLPNFALLRWNFIALSGVARRPSRRSCPRARARAASKVGRVILENAREDRYSHEGNPREFLGLCGALQPKPSERRSSLRARHARVGPKPLLRLNSAAWFCVKLSLGKLHSCPAIALGHQRRKDFCRASARSSTLSNLSKVACDFDLLTWGRARRSFGAVRATGEPSSSCPIFCIGGEQFEERPSKLPFTAAPSRSARALPSSPRSLFEIDQRLKPLKSSRFAHAAPNSFSASADACFTLSRGEVIPERDHCFSASPPHRPAH